MVKQSLSLAWLSIGSIILSLMGTEAGKAQNAIFVCTVTTDNLPTTLAQTPDGPVEVFKWQSNYFRPPYTPMQRCQEVTDRMNVFNAQGMMDYITTGNVNNQPVLCAGSTCDRNGSNVLLTLRPDQNPNQVLQEINANRMGAAGPSRQLSGGSSTASGFLRQNNDGSITLNVKKYLGSASSKPFNSNSNNPSNSPIFQNNPTSPTDSGRSPGRKW